MVDKKEKNKGKRKEKNAEERQRTSFFHSIFTYRLSVTRTLVET